MRSSTNSRKKRGLWPSSNQKLDPLADHLGNERLKDLINDPNHHKSLEKPTFLIKQRSCTEFSMFEKSEKNAMISKENHKPLLGGSMRYTRKLCFPERSLTSDFPDLDEDVVPGRFSVDETGKSDKNGKISKDYHKNFFGGSMRYTSSSTSNGSLALDDDIVLGRFSIDENALRRRSLARSDSESESDCSTASLGKNSATYMNSTVSSRNYEVSSKYKISGPASFNGVPRNSGVKSAIKMVNSPTVAMGKGRPISFSNLRPPTSPSRVKGVGNLLSMGLDLFRGKKAGASGSSALGLGAAESVHQLRLNHNRLVQWRYANARTEAVNGNVAIQAQIKLLGAWGDMERQHLSAVSMTKDCLHSVICRVPLVEGAKMEPCSTSIALRRASDLATSIKSILYSFLPTTKKTALMLSELAKTVTQEKALLEEFLELLRIISTLEANLNRQIHADDIEAGGSTGNETIDLDKFFEDVEKVKDDMKDVEGLYKRLQEANEESKTVHNAQTMKELRSRMDLDVQQVLKRVKVIKGKLEALERSNADHQRIPGCGPGSSADRTRTSVVSGLGKKLKVMMDEFQARLKRRPSTRRQLERRYFTITGEKANEELIENIISSGESESFLQKAIQDQGRGQILDTISEIQERHDAVKEIEKNLIELHQVFLDMAALVEAQGQQLNNMESHVAHASSFVRRGTEQLQEAREHQKSSRKWTCIAIGLGAFVLLHHSFPSFVICFGLCSVETIELCQWQRTIPVFCKPIQVSVFPFS
ncbi:syntaxin of plants 125 [Actinidia rufa]|uniref:Syntaxin of plants 125 n=1 Tax=Actinidia rufa TaxID=165716 RepID=A0A7J0FK37_9ERIC|nr:syntaxin of plants 125 [Actinidia rufa]